MKATKILKSTLHELGVNNNKDWEDVGIDKIVNIEQDMTIHFLMKDGNIKKIKSPVSFNIENFVITETPFLDNNIVVSQTVQLDLINGGFDVSDLSVSSSNENVATIINNSGLIEIHGIAEGRTTFTINIMNLKKVFTINVTTMTII